MKTAITPTASQRRMSRLRRRRRVRRRRTTTWTFPFSGTIYSYLRRPSWAPRLEAHPTTEELGAVGVPYHRRRAPQTKGDPPSYGDHGSRRRNGLHNNILWISPASRASTLRPTVA